MRLGRSVSLSLALLLLASPASARSKGGKGKSMGEITINGQKASVYWSDGDSFRFRSGMFKNKGTRVMGFNTLESYGPVHRWGTWKAEELYYIAKSSAAVCASKVWECTTDGKPDGYDRLLVSCPELAKEMIRQGKAFVFSVETPADPELLKVQKEAQANKAGIWEKGVPSHIVSSLHSATESKPYNRVVDTRTGMALEKPHTDNYSECQEVCVGKGDDTSCLVYVPFSHRYKNKPDCLLPWKKSAAKDDKEEVASDGEAPVAGD